MGCTGGGIAPPPRGSAAAATAAAAKPRFESIGNFLKDLVLRHAAVNLCVTGAVVDAHGDVDIARAGAHGLDLRAGATFLVAATAALAAAAAAAFALVQRAALVAVAGHLAGFAAAAVLAAAAGDWIGTRQTGY